MLPWSLKRLSKRDQFFLQLSAFIFFAHIIVLILFFIWSRPAPLTIKINHQMMQAGVPIRVVPFMRQTGQLKKMSQAQGKRNHTQKKSSPKSRKVSKAVLKKEQPKKTTIKKVAPKKVPMKKNLPKKDISKKEEKRVVNKKPLQQEKKTVPPIKDVVPEPEVLLAKDGAKTEIEEIVVGQQEYEAIQLYQEIHDELSHTWHPPAGLKPKKTASILMTLSADGVVQALILEQSSGILVYDMAARMAVSKARYPKKVWGQQLRLHF